MFMEYLMDVMLRVFVKEGFGGVKEGFEDVTFIDYIMKGYLA